MGGIVQSAIPTLLALAMPGKHLRILWASLPIIGLMLVGAAIIAAVKRWRERPVSSRLTSSDELAHFRSLYEEGELSEEEFSRLQSVLGVRIKKELEIPPADAGPPATGPTAPPSANGTSPAHGSPEPQGPHDPPAR